MIDHGGEHWAKLYRYFVVVLVKAASGPGLTYLQDGRGYGRVNTSDVFTGP